MVTLQEVFYPSLAVVGIPSNTVTFLIIWRRNCMLSRSSTYYLMAISVADNLVLIFIVVLELSVKYHQREPFWSYEPWCSLRDIFNYGAYNASTWLVVVFTVERFVAIHTWKMKTKICTPRCASWTITAVFFFSHLFAIPYYWSNVSVYLNNQTRCIYKTEAPTQFIHTLVWFQTLQAYIFPFLIILTLNGLTLRLISLSNRVHVTTDLTSRINKVMPLLRSRKRKSVVLLVTVSMSFVLLSVTRAITQIILRTTHMYTFDRNDYNLPINIAADTGTMLSLSNAAANMYLYVCTQSKFRQEFLGCARQASFYCKTKL
ncbi:probable G-protein coupled receptor 139 [Toxotes jaculatrix]|uniref:probable G-protein coupled receptor 139 n=1 Tax=Toxotes jaculatrix TaxID=941984 RepID=UPI001B3AE393|nr:probable G-protein coupled receptor 139 [Toxotes jaculatrix]